MITKIGIVAGEIWSLLGKEDKLPLSILLSKIGKNIAEDEKVIYMGVGWLVRKGHIILTRIDSDYIACLRKLFSK